MKARSRLKLQEKRDADAKMQNLASPPEHKSKPKEFFAQKYLKHSPLLLLGLVSSYFVYSVLTQVEPASADLFNNRSYVLLLVPVFFSVFFVSSFVTLNSRMGSVLALGTTTLLFFRLHQFELNLLLIMFSFGIYGVCWMILKVVWRVTKS